MRGRGCRPEGGNLGDGASGHVAERRPPREALRPNPRHFPSGRRRKAPRRIRLFIALDLPEAVRLGVDAWGRRALADPALRRIAASNLRTTLVFLGHRPEAEVCRLMATIRQVCGSAAAPLVELRAPEPRPPRGKPRLFVLPAISAGAEIFHLGLAAALVDRALYAPEGRPFRPHLTVARVRALRRESRQRMLVRDMPAGPLPLALAEPFYAESVGLYRSDLDPTGARHDLLGRVELLGSG